MKNLKLLSLLLLIGLSTNIFAQFQITGQFRTRNDNMHGYKKIAGVDSETSFFVSQRSRINLDYKSDKYTVKFSLQDVRLWGDEDVYNGTGVVRKSFNTIDVFEAWVDLKLCEHSNLKIGRQVLNYDDGRLISGRNWWQSGMSYDALLYKYNNKDMGLSVDVGLTLNNHTENLFGNDYYTDRMKTMDYLYVKKSFSKKLYVSFMTIGSGYQKAGTTSTIYMMGTEGFHLNYNAGKKPENGLFSKLNIFMQNGKNRAGQDVSANMFTAEIGYRLMDKKLAISAGVDYLSGNDDADTTSAYNEIDHTFSLLYGGRFPYYGGNLCQIVINDKNLKGAGLMNPHFKVSYKFSDKASVNFAFHMNMLANNLTATNDSTKEFYDKNLGNNIDLSFTYKFNKEVVLKIGGSYGMPSDTFIRMQNVIDSNGNYKAGTNYYAWAMLIIKPSFFVQKEKQKN